MKRGNKSFKIVRTIRLFILIGIHFCFTAGLVAISKKSIIEKVETSMIAAALGDVFGGVTEFHDSQQQLFRYHPNGILSIDNFTNTDWTKFPAQYREKKIAPYTDDTAMALLVADYLIQSEETSKELDDAWAEGLASAFIADVNNPYGWKAPFRAPGISTMKAVALLSDHKKNEWPSMYKQFENHQGCGSIMRAYPCGLLFWKDPQKGEKAAMIQSKVTHNSLIARTSCAALARGLEFLLGIEIDGDSGEIVSRQQVNQALVYTMKCLSDQIDKGSVLSTKIEEAYQAGQRAACLLERFEITTPEQLVQELKKENSEVARHHFDVCKKFPGWKADDALAAAVYSVSAAIQVPYLAIVLGVHSTGDSDSIASLVGSLIGAWYGKKALPEQVWQKEIFRIEGIDRIKECAKQLAALSFRVRP